MRLAAWAGAGVLFAGCFKEDEAEKPLPVELNRNHACRVCGMIGVDFPGAKAQIHYKNIKVDSFCGTLDIFSFYLQPDRPRNIAAIYVNNMGPMGEALVPFLDLKDAETYVKKHGGKIYRFDEVTMDMLRPE